ncbi:MAG: IPT/TIG domain-containing protein [Myxococcales bacterium]|nr:IPT/TIG domain-containing protein [Myxococcales bacterium]
MTVVNPDGLTHTLRDGYVYFAPPPLLRAVAPAVGGAGGGYEVVVSGRNLGAHLTVDFGGALVTSFNRASADELAFFAPPHAPGLVDVAVATGDGQHDMLPDMFLYVDDSALSDPRITTIEPTSGPPAGGYLMHVRGANFAPDAQVAFGDTPALSTEWLNDGLLAVLVPPGPPETAVDVSVHNSLSAVAVAPAAFSYESTFIAPLRIGAVRPGVGPTDGGTVVVIEGDGFVAGSTVTVGGADATNVTLVSSTMLTAVTPAGAGGLADVVVQRPDGAQTVAAKAFGYVPAGLIGASPTITAASPPLGPKAGGALVLLRGERFATGATVWFGGNQAPSVTFVDETTVAVRTPARAAAGTVAIAMVLPSGAIGVLPGGYTYYDATGATPPTVLGASPTTGSTYGGEDVGIAGSGFAGGARAYLCDRPAVVRSLTGDGLLAVTTPSAAPGACSVAVVNPDGLTGEKSEAFEFVAPTPVVTGVIPAVGPTGGGVDVVIQGQDFVPGASVRFGNAASPLVTVANRTTLTARIPSHPQATVSVTVVNPGSQQALGTLENAFTFLDEINGDPPQIDVITPGTGPVGGGTPVRVLGEGFLPGAVVVFDASVIPDAEIVSAYELRFVTPPRAAAGEVDVTVLNPNGLGATVPSGFAYLDPSTPPPTITTIVPNGGPEAGGNTISIAGTNFRATGTWTLGGQVLDSVATFGDTVTARAPAHAPGPVDLVYVGPDGQVAVKVAAYEYRPAPVLDRLLPAIGGIAGDTRVTLVGENFAPGMSVLFGGVPGSVILVASSTTVDVKTPPAAAPGFVDVTVRNADLQSTTRAQAYEYIAPPVVTSLWPPQGPVAGGTLVELTGTGFHPGSRVWFGPNQATEVAFGSSTSLFAFVPVATTASVVSVQVKNPDDKESTLADAFTYLNPGQLGLTPFITEIFPVRGPSSGGTRVGFSGANFVAGGRAVFLAKVATLEERRGDRAIAVAPAHEVGEADVFWVGPDGQTVQAPSAFTYVDPASLGAAPVISAVTPSEGSTAGGLEVAVVGQNFQAGARVRFGGDDGTGESEGANELHVRTPAHARGPVSVWVVNPDGTQRQWGGSFLFLAAPRVTKITPKQGPTDGGTRATLEGTSLLEDPQGALPQVLFCAGFAARSSCAAVDPTTMTAATDGTSLTFDTPQHAAGLVEVGVVAPDGQEHGLAAAFTYTLVPTITDVTPDAGSTRGGDLVTLTGTGFQPGLAVTFGGVSCTSITVNGPTSLTCVTPTGASGTVDVKVRNLDGGQVTAVEGYTYIAPPTIDRVVPNLAAEGVSGIEAVVNGHNFGVGARVFFNATELDIVSLTSTNIRVAVPDLTGTVDVIVRNPDGQESRLTDGFTYIPPLQPPTAAFISPRTGSTLGGDTFQIAGANFLAGAIVEFGHDNVWSPATNVGVRNNGTLVTGNAPAYPAGTVSVRVTNSDGQAATLANAFEFVRPPDAAPLNVINIEPARAIVAGGVWITVAGTGFRANAQITFTQGTETVGALDVQRFGPTLLRAKVPQAPLRIAGPATLTVTNPQTFSLPAEVYSVTDFFEYIDGTVFVRSPGDRLPHEDTTAVTDGSLVFDADGDELEDVLIFKRDADDQLLMNGFEGRPGWFSRRTFHTDATSYHLTQWAAARDWDGDGDLDVFRVIQRNSDNLLEYCENDAAIFSCRGIYASGTTCGTSYQRWNRVEFGDLNCDGRDDIFVPMNSTSCKNAIILNLGDSQFRATTDPLPDDLEYTRAAALGDVDGDGDVDIILGQDQSTINRLYLNNCMDLQVAAEPNGCAMDLPWAVTTVYGGKRYARSTYTTNWADARHTCQAFGMDLVKIDDRDEDAHVRWHADNRGYNMWIGLRDTDGNNVDEWVPGTTNLPSPPRILENNDPPAFVNSSGGVAGTSGKFANNDGRFGGPAHPDYVYQRFCTPGAFTFPEDISYGFTQVGEPTLCTYNPSEPNNTSQDCVYYYWNNSGDQRGSCWDDVACTSNYYYLCEDDTLRNPCGNAWAFTNVQYPTTFPLSGGDTRDALLIDVDHDEDHRLDVVFINHGEPSKVFINGGPQAGGKLFTDKSGDFWPADAPNLRGAVATDIDLDGDLDLIGFSTIYSSGTSIDHWSPRIYLSDRYGLSYRQPGCSVSTGSCRCNPTFETCETVQEPEGTGRFTEVSGTRWGPHGRDDSTDDVRTNGSGQYIPFSVGDLDADGYPDVYIAGYSYSDRMVMNNGYEEGTAWVDENRVGIGHFRFNAYRSLPELYAHDSTSFAFGDVNGDGAPDLMIAGYDDPLKLWLNDGAGNFADVSSTHLPGDYRYRTRRHSITLVDLDDDGDNDFVLEGTDYPYSCPSGVDCYNHLELVNDGTGHFVDRTSPNYTVTREWGTEVLLPIDLDLDGDMDWLIGSNYSNSQNSRVAMNGGNALGVGGAYVFDQTSPWMSQVDRANITDFEIIDVNGDAFPDVFVGTSGASRVWTNFQGQFFVNSTLERDHVTPFFSATSTGTRDIVTIDIDNDGDLDIIDVVSGVNRLYVRDGANGFVDRTASMPQVSADSVCAAVGDLDLDGFDDLYIANWNTKNQLFTNLGGSGFSDTSGGLPWDALRSQCVFLYDFDHDGDLDALVPSNNDQSRIFINTIHSP